MLVSDLESDEEIYNDVVFKKDMKKGRYIGKTYDPNTSRKYVYYLSNPQARERKHLKKRPCCGLCYDQHLLPWIFKKHLATSSLKWNVSYYLSLKNSNLLFIFLK